MATPFYGTMYATGADGKAYAVEMYLADSAGSVNFDGGAGSGSGSPIYWQAPQDLVITDFAFETAATMKAFILASNAVPTGHRLRLATHLTTNTARPKLNIRVNKGSQLSATQA